MVKAEKFNKIQKMDRQQFHKRRFRRLDLLKGKNRMAMAVIKQLQGKILALWELFTVSNG